MKIGLTLFGALIFTFVSWDTFSQQSLTRDKILEEYRTTQTNPSLDSVFRWDVHLQTRATLDNLLKNGIDTLVVYSVRYPGYGRRSDDSCSVRGSIYSYFFWTSHGNYFIKKVDGQCESKELLTTRKVIKFTLDNYPQIRKEFFMGATFVKTIDGQQKILESTVDHEAKYSLLIRLNDQSKYLSFTQNGLEDKESLFLDYNKGLVSFRLFRIIQKEIRKD